MCPTRPLVPVHRFGHGPLPLLLILARRQAKRDRRFARRVALYRDWWLGLRSLSGPVLRPMSDKPIARQVALVELHHLGVGGFPIGS